MLPARELYDNCNGPVNCNLSVIDRRDARRPPSATPDGVGTAALRLRRGDCAICGWRFGTIGEFAPCAAWVFRPLRPAGISRLARRDRGRCPLDPCDFLKKIE